MSENWKGCIKEKDLILLQERQKNIIANYENLKKLYFSQMQEIRDELKEIKNLMTHDKEKNEERYATKEDIKEIKETLKNNYVKTEDFAIVRSSQKMTNWLLWTLLVAVLLAVIAALLKNIWL